MVNSKNINDVNSVIIALLKARKNKSTIPVAKIDSSYCGETGVHIPYRKLGFSSVVDYLKTVPGVEVIMEDNVSYVNFIGTKNSQHTSDYVSNKQPRDSLPKTYQPGKIGALSDLYRAKKRMSKDIPECILTILRKSSRGISKTKLLEELNYEYGVNVTMFSLNCHLTDLRKLVTIKDGLVYENTNEGIELPASDLASSKKQSCSNDIVNTTITDYESVGEMLFSDFNKNKKGKNGAQLIEVEVVESYSPSFFWIHLLKNIKEFNEMMTTLGDYYKIHRHDHEVSSVMLERGLNIACLFDGKWHRAIIKSVDHNSKVTVMFYDYGTISKCPSNEVYHLHQSFTKLPAQAVPCGLYNIAPYNGDNKWPKRTRDLFNQWVYEKPLWAHIVEVDVEKKSMLVTLVDTSSCDDLIMNNWLINNNMARVKKMGCVDPEDMNLYVDEFYEYSIDDDGVYKTIIPTTRHPESSSGILSIDDSLQSVGSLTNELDLYKYDWKAFKSQIRSKVDEFTVLTMELLHDFTKNNTESSAHGIIRNFVGQSLTDSILELLFSFLDLDLPAQFTGTSVASNESRAEIDDRQSERTNELTNESSSFADIADLVTKEMQKETNLIKLEALVEEAVSKYFKNRIVNDLENLTIDSSSPLTKGLLDTNPFKEFFIDDKLKENDTEPPPLPSGPFNVVPKLQETVDEAHSVMYDSSKHWNPFVSFDDN